MRQHVIPAQWWLCQAAARRTFASEARWNEEPQGEAERCNIIELETRDSKTRRLEDSKSFHVRLMLTFSFAKEHDFFEAFDWNAMKVGTKCKTLNTAVRLFELISQICWISWRVIDTELRQLSQSNNLEPPYTPEVADEKAPSCSCWVYLPMVLVHS